MYAFLYSIFHQFLVVLINYYYYYYYYYYYVDICVNVPVGEIVIIMSTHVTRQVNNTQ